MCVNSLVSNIALTTCTWRWLCGSIFSLSLYANFRSYFLLFCISISSKKNYPSNIKGTENFHIILFHNMLITISENDTSCTHLSGILNLFRDLIGSKVNKSKIEISFPKNCFLHPKHHTRSTLGSEKGIGLFFILRLLSFIIAYLSSFKVQLWIISIIVQKWNKRFLCQVDKLVLIHFILNTLPFFSLANNCIMEKITSRISSITESWDDTK